MSSEKRYLHINFDAPAEVHSGVRRACDDIYVQTGVKKKVPDLYQDLIVAGLQDFGDEISVPEFVSKSGRCARTIFYISRSQRNAVDGLKYVNGEDMSINDKYAALIANGLKTIYEIDIY